MIPSEHSPSATSRAVTPAWEGLRVDGLVQGVGFRPFVWHLAREEGLRGRVWNDAEGVGIALWGPQAGRERFRRRLRAEAPPLARIDAVRSVPVGEERPPADFTIVSSGEGPARTGIVPDAPVCAACLEELFDPAGRRNRYAFLNCTHCGPRYTITGAVPYDRPSTALAGFPMCPDCAAEYADPGDRRFHAQATACPACGPRLVFRRAGDEPEGGDAIAAALGALGAGAVVAIKGLGGYHLAVDARNERAVERLRERKERGGKPFALMAANTASLDGVAVLDEAARAALEGPARPIVLLPKTEAGERRLPGIAPGLVHIGFMLPYAPIHYLLFHEAAGRPAGREWLEAPQPLLLVMTSANPGGEPLVTDNHEAERRLSGIADAFLEHDRPILVGCDDSVVRPRDRGAPVFLRRSRGHVPAPVVLPEEGPSVLATGGWLKNTVCLTRGGEAFPSQHVGDLANGATIRVMESAAAHLRRVLEVDPRVVACDLHPDFPSTRFAQELADRWDVPLVAVQHHHAHIAAVAAEHGLTGPVLGVALDGVGLGPAGEVWGGELLRVDGADYRALGGLRPIPLPGGDRAAREPWRTAAGLLYLLGQREEIPARFRREGAERIADLMDRGLNCPWTSSAGRLFDAAAALLGLREITGFEGQAAMELEGRAQSRGPVPAMSGGYRIAGGQLDPAPLMEALADCRDSGWGAAVFHATLAAGIVDWVASAAAAQGLDRVLLGGGCWANRILEEDVRSGLAAAGLRVFTAEALPPGDGGLSLGQAWVAARTMNKE
ncbi:carbamoyltransferase HypF [Thiohalorhabdus methylotrophus]|uniref:Carbamoyltransferase HypF n=1 Tax=Thiohalorhabdus methylotrophus TaxID=3242694 RepID=A0ABV4TW90_9GAMM